MPNLIKETNFTYNIQLERVDIIRNTRDFDLKEKFSCHRQNKKWFNLARLKKCLIITGSSMRNRCNLMIETLLLQFNKLLASIFRLNANMNSKPQYLLNVLLVMQIDNLKRKKWKYNNLYFCINKFSVLNSNYNYWNDLELSNFWN